MGGRNGPLQPGSSLPAFAFPEQAAGVLGRSHLYGAWLADEADAPLGDVGDIDRARRPRHHQPPRSARGDAVLDVADVVAVLGAYGIVAPETRRGARRGRRRRSPTAIGYPVAVKAEHRHLGRSVKAGVALDLADADDVTDAVRTMRDALGADADVVVVQPMVAAGPRPAHPQHARRPPRPARRGRARQLDGRPRHRRGVTAGAAVVGERRPRCSPAHAPARRCDQAKLPTAPVVELLMRVAQLVSDHAEIDGRRPQPDHRVERGRRRHRRGRARPRRRCPTTARCAGWSERSAWKPVG